MPCEMTLEEEREGRKEEKRKEKKQGEEGGKGRIKQERTGWDGMG